ncbi:hypothetical protein [Aestuariivirga sp.]|uniref:hypothetical protein n=1 Tax=Aestuariivirga sp. TaxID=2650926 RepID=UPI0035946A85
MTSISLHLLAAATVSVMLTFASAAQATDVTRFTANPPPSVLTPDSIQTGVGELRFKDGARGCPAQCRKLE